MAEQAKRVADYLSRDKTSPSYWKQDGIWYLHLPDHREDSDFDGLTANLARHQIVEHDDGTISVTPSILVSQELFKGAQYTKIESHGYLTRGVWTEC